MNKVSGCRWIVLIMFLLSACVRTPFEGTYVWIDVPVDRLSFDELQMLKIKGHATAPGGVERVDIHINETLLTTITDLEFAGKLASFQTTWTPTDFGIFMITAFAYGDDGSTSEPDLAMVTFSTDVVVELSTTEIIAPTISEDVVVDLLTTEMITPTLYDKTEIPSVTPSPENTDMVEAFVEFWADPLPVPAGGCTTLYWEAEQVSTLIFGGIEQDFKGSFQVCDVCQEQNYRLIVTYLDQSVDTLWVTITMAGTCVTPTATFTMTPTPTATFTMTPTPTATHTKPPPDTTPPPVPDPFVPADGLSLSCRSTQALTWLPVTDPSGVSEYRVEVQRSSDNNTWNSAPGSPINGIIDKTTQINVECGWYYRWRVQAVDGAGNMSAWSAWSYFSITLE